MNALAVPKTHLVLIAGGCGLRLGGRCKYRIEIADKPIVNHICTATAELISGDKILIGPPDEQLTGFRFAQEQPAGGGPAAGLAAAVSILPLDAADIVFVSPSDAPGAGFALRALAMQLPLPTGTDGIIVQSSSSDGVFPQYLLGIYRLRSLQRIFAQCPSHNRSVRSILQQLELSLVQLPEPYWRDIDTPADLQWWQEQKDFLTN